MFEINELMSFITGTHNSMYPQVIVSRVIHTLHPHVTHMLPALQALTPHNTLSVHLHG